jgi:hypothetical protein
MKNEIGKTEGKNVNDNEVRITDKCEVEHSDKNLAGETCEGILALQQERLGKDSKSSNRK